MRWSNWALLAVAVIAFGCDESNPAGNDAADVDVSDVADVTPDADVMEEASCVEAGEAVLETRETLATVIASFERDVGSALRLYANAMLCRCSPAIDFAEVLAETGGCRITRSFSGALEDCTALDAGTVTVSVDGTDFALEAMPGAPCFLGVGGTTPTVAAGDPVRIWSTGGTDVPTFDVTLDLPPDLDPARPEEDEQFARCEAWRFEWTTGLDASTRVGLSGGFGETSYSLSCSPVSSPLDVPVEITSAWPGPGAGQAYAMTFEERVVPGTMPVTVTVRNALSGTVQVTIE